MKKMRKNRGSLFGVLFLVLSVIMLGTGNMICMNIDDNDRNEVLLYSSSININFVEAVAIYHKNESSEAIITVNLPDLKKVDVEIIDIDNKTVVKRKSYSHDDAGFSFNYPFKM